MTRLSAPNVRHYAYFAVAIVLASAIISTSLIVAPALEGTKTTTETMNSTTTVSSTTTVTIGSTLYQPCNNYAWNMSSPTPYMQHIPVLLMQPNSTGYVCVTYQTAWQGNQSLYQSDSMYNSYPFLVNGTYQFGPFLVDNYTCSIPNEINSCAQTISHSFKISVLPDSIRPSASMNYVTEVYIVTALGNSTGFYGDSAPWTGCIGMPMAVGYSASQVNASDFTQSPGASCFVQLFVPVAEYVTGMNVTYIDSVRP
jgi:hypothetical protein